jgi:hypothetical protein
VLHKVQPFHPQGSSLADYSRGNWGFFPSAGGDKNAKVARNHQSELDKQEVVKDKLMKELQAGRMRNPFPAPVFPHFCVSPLGLNKKKEPGKFRVIHDLS